MSGGCRPPRAPMGPEPLSLSGERAEGARRADRGEHTGGLPRFGPRWTRKTLLLLGCIELGSSGAWRASYTEPMAVWIASLRTEPFLRCTRASFYSAKGSPTGVNVRGRGKSVKGVEVVTVRERWRCSAAQCYHTYF